MTRFVDDEVPPDLYSVTVYVARDQLARTSAFYRDVLQLASMFLEPNHIECFELLHGVSLCVHEEEEGHPAGGTELHFGTDDAAAFVSRAMAADFPVTAGQYVGGGDWSLLTDGSGTQVRLSRRTRPA